MTNEFPASLCRQYMVLVGLVTKKRGWHWALTSFTFEAWNNSEKE
jgi:hypothetical protein